ncbi:Phage integrase family protein [Mycetohabitans rhizoxinica HKI 454]|uniref:Phage integrase family protein n=1 Tax=Mycetohabitans rhizoxinica (strain DSM 19002 / CIP 109453 / HKI 454) TaxID=882378 RepID=E5AKL9_MYCRK|nr:Phage integrase family protein [Mycetohabitans rhizoxinica HKI 454]
MATPSDPCSCSRFIQAVFLCQTWKQFIPVQVKWQALRLTEQKSPNNYLAMSLRESRDCRLEKGKTCVTNHSRTRFAGTSPCRRTRVSPRACSLHCKAAAARASFPVSLKRPCVLIFLKNDLRHAWASWHVQRGTSLHVLEELGGWETMEMVQRYAHLSCRPLDAMGDAA